MNSEDIKLPVVHEPTSDDLVDSALQQLNPKQQRFVHLYLSGGYTIPQIAELLNMSVSGVRKWLKTPEIKAYIDDVQKEEDEIVRQGLKALRLKALFKLGKLIDSNIDGVALTAVDRVLDRTGHKAPTKQEVDITIKTFEQQIIELAKESGEDIIEINDYTIDKD
jgi:phage terminase small subunit